MLLVGGAMALNASPAGWLMLQDLLTIGMLAA